MSEGRRWFPILLALVAGGIALASYVQPNPISDGLLQVAALLTAVGLLFGILNVLNVHHRRIVQRAKDWPYSIVLIVALVVTFVIGVLPTVLGDTSLTALVLDMSRYVYQPLAGSLIALLTFFALRASWRAFQLRLGEAAIVLGVAVVVLLASGPWAALVPGLTETLQWIRDYPVLGVARGLLIGVGIGALVAGMRLLLGFDQPYLDR